MRFPKDMLARPYKGGAWLSSKSGVRPAIFDGNYRDFSGVDLGFRVVMGVTNASQS